MKQFWTAISPSKCKELQRGYQYLMNPQEVFSYTQLTKIDISWAITLSPALYSGSPLFLHKISCQLSSVEDDS
jgi:hypothetical protein